MNTSRIQLTPRRLPAVLRHKSAWFGSLVPSRRSLAIAVPSVWLALVLAIPFLLVLKISFSDVALRSPPYTDTIVVSDSLIRIVLSLQHYANVVTDSLYVSTYLSSLKIAAISTVLCLVIGFPFAYCISRASPARRNFLLLGVMLPFWTSFLLRVYAWVGILKDDGILNRALMAAGLIASPLRLYHTDIGVYIGMVYSYLPFMVMPLCAHLMKMDMRLIEAAYDLGAGPVEAFFRVTIPLARSGIIAGSLLVFIPSVGEYVIPELLGGSDTLMIGRLMWDEFFNNMDWPAAAAITIAMMALLLVPIAVFQHFQNRERGGEA
ncbi:ABC transporter permease subunit [Burkholderia sp. Bp9017]|uniref:ABC transporter permease subunit n=1 Tax=Burkholderia TaxID=32008 RepID=UPI000F5E81DA|nr:MULTISPECIES: ABC transporter permease subunit [Burkholderia]MBY4871097.1 ABC transporter permease subunit [Burkholderia anthina]RQZ26792.1 ABC transporter permease subunit [Burkholderia sp. Bp9017]